MLNGLRKSFSVIASFVAAVAADEEDSFGAGATSEKELLSFLIDHHTMVIELAKIGTTKASRGELKALCEVRAERSRAERDLLHHWFEEWYYQGHEPVVTARELFTLQTLGSLGGSRFEAEFMKELIRHHRDGVARAEKDVRNGSHGALRRLTQSSSNGWQRESHILERWLHLWQGRPA